MLKLAAAIAVPSVVGSMSLLHDGRGPEPMGPHFFDGSLVEIGVAFDEAAVRAVLPEGLEPVPGFTGGIAVYLGEDGVAASPHSTSYVWIDVMEGGAARYLIRSHQPEDLHLASTIPLDQGSLGVMHELGTDGVLRVTARTDGFGTLDLAVRPAGNRCATGPMSLAQYLFASTAEGGLEVLPGPVVMGPCDAAAVSASLGAAASDALGALAPERLLWAEIATPL